MGWQIGPSVARACTGAEFARIPRSITLVEAVLDGDSRHALHNGSDSRLLRKATQNVDNLERGLVRDPTSCRKEMAQHKLLALPSASQALDLEQAFPEGAFSDGAVGSSNERGVLLPRAESRRLRTRLCLLLRTFCCLIVILPLVLAIVCATTFTMGFKFPLLIYLTGIAVPAFTYSVENVRCQPMTTAHEALGSGPWFTLPCTPCGTHHAPPHAVPTRLESSETSLVWWTRAPRRAGRVQRNTMSASALFLRRRLRNGGCTHTLLSRRRHLYSIGWRARCMTR